MSIDNFANELSLVIATASEFEHYQYELSIAVGSRGPTGHVNYAIAINHSHEKLADKQRNTLALVEIGVFQAQFDEFPTTLIVCDVNDVPNEIVVTQMKAFFEEAALLPSPNEAGDVVLLTIPLWNES